MERIDNDVNKWHLGLSTLRSVTVKEEGFLPFDALQSKDKLLCLDRIARRLPVSKSQEVSDGPVPISPDSRQSFICR